MEYDDDNLICDIKTLPTEILIILFKFLSPKDVTRCRQVCIRWRDIINFIRNDAEPWRGFCKSDYNVGPKEMWKSPNITTWFDMYQSLAIWPDMLRNHPTVKVFCSSKSTDEDIQRIAIQENGVIMVHKEERVNFYDILTLECANRKQLCGNFDMFEELEDFIIIIQYPGTLFILQKPHRNWCFDLDVYISQKDFKSFGNIKRFLVGDRTVFFYSRDDELFAVNLDDDLFCQENMGYHIVIPEGMETNAPMCTWSYKDGCLYLMTMTGNMYMYANGTVYLKFNMCSVANMMDCFYQHSMLENMNWEHYYLLMGDAQHSHQEAQYISFMRFHRGDTVFVGTEGASNIKIYYKPFMNGELVLHKFAPVRVYDLSVGLCAGSLYPFSDKINRVVNGIEVVQIKGGFKIVVSLQKQVIVFTYCDEMIMRYPPEAPHHGFAGHCSH